MRRAVLLCLLGILLWIPAAEAATTYIAGEDLAAGDVVTFNAAGDVMKTTVATNVVVGVVYQAASTGQAVPVETTDDITVKVQAGTAALRYLNPSTTAGVALGTSAPTASTFGYTRTAESGGTCSMQFLRVGGATGGGAHPVDLVTDVTGVLDETNIDPAVARDAELPNAVAGREDGASVVNAVDAIDLGPGLDGTNPGGATFLVTPDPEELEGVALSDLVFWAPFDNQQTGSPQLLYGNGGYLAPASSGVGWFLAYRFDGGAEDQGTSDVSPAAGTALPAGVTVSAAGPTPLALQMGGDGAATNFLTVTGDPIPPGGSVADTEGFMLWCTLNEPTGAGDNDDVFDASGGQGVELTIDKNGATTADGYYRLDYVDSAGLKRISVNTSVDDGTDKTLIVTLDGTNWTSYVNGILDHQEPDPRTSATTLSFDQGNVSIGAFTGASTFGIMDGRVGFIAMFEGIVPADFPEYINNLADADRELIGQRFIRGKFGEGRLFLGGDYERYDSEGFQSMRAAGTLSLWFQPVFDSDTTTITADCVLFEQLAEAAEGWRLEFDPDPTTPKWIATIATGSGVVTAELAATGPGAFTDGTWVHLAMTWDQSTLRLYVNGALAQASALGAEPLPGGELAAAFTFGNQAGGAANPANGVLDHVKADNRAWTATEVAHEAAATRPH